MTNARWTKMKCYSFKEFNQIQAVADVHWNVSLIRALFSEEFRHKLLINTEVQHQQLRTYKQLNQIASHVRIKILNWI